MHKKLLGFVYFAAAVLILVAVLKVTNWLPTVLQEGGMRKYSSIEEVKSKLRIRDIYVPSYFPQRLAWPPSRILAQSRPSIAVVMEFRHGDTGEIALVISQSGRKDFAHDRQMSLVQVREIVSYPLKDRTASLEVGTCRNDVPCSRITWNEGGYWITVVMKSPPFELLKIAESMLR